MKDSQGSAYLKKNTITEKESKTLAKDLFYQLVTDVSDSLKTKNAKSNAVIESSLGTYKNKEEFAKRNKTAKDMVLWNMYSNDKFTQTEHAALLPNAREKREWNKTSEEKYTEEEIGK